MNDENCVKLCNAHLAGCLDEHHVLLPLFASLPEPVDYSQQGGFVSVAAPGEFGIPSDRGTNVGLLLLQEPLFQDHREFSQHTQFDLVCFVIYMI